MKRTTQPNISKSVARAFAVLETFRSRRQPMTAATLRHKLDIPQPSIRALLKNLVDLGYLHFDADDKTYFPTMQLAGLGDWVGNSALAGIDVSALIDDITFATGETASLNIINALNIEIVYTRTAAHPLGLQLRPGIGEALWLTAAGRSLLGTCDEAVCERLLQAMIRRERNPKNRQQILALAPLLQDIRAAGCYCGYDVYLKGVGAICVGATLGHQPVVIAVAGVKDRIGANEQEILRVIRTGLQRWQAAHPDHPDHPDQDGSSRSTTRHTGINRTE